jgi:hypothetical protein
MVIGVTAGKGGVGKSVIASLLSWAAVELGRRAVLFDLNLANPDQLALGRVQFARVPGRMPTVLDDSYPTQWWSDPEDGFFLVPGPRAARDRTSDSIVAGALRLIPRAGEEFDAVVLDLHQVGTDRYTRDLIGRCDVVACVVDHDPRSRQHLREWLDEATGLYPTRNPFMPELDVNQVRLIYSEGVDLEGRDRERRFSEAAADLGASYVIAGRLDFDAAIVGSGTSGDLTRRVNAATRRVAIEAVERLLGLEPPPMPSRSLLDRALRRPAHRPTPPPSFDHLIDCGRGADSARRPGRRGLDRGLDPDHGEPRDQVDSELCERAQGGRTEPDVPISDEPCDGRAHLVRVFGPPRVDADCRLGERALELASLLAVRAPLSKLAAAEAMSVDRRRISPKTVGNHASGLKGIVASEAGMLTLDHDVESELAMIVNVAESVARADDLDVGCAIERAIATLAATRGAPFEGREWRWVHERTAVGLSPAERCVRELENLARTVADRWLRARRRDGDDVWSGEVCSPLASGTVVTSTIVGVSDRVSQTFDPVPMLSAAALVAHSSLPTDRSLVRARLDQVAGEGWPVGAELLRLLA